MCDICIHGAQMLAAVGIPVWFAICSRGKKKLAKIKKDKKVKKEECHEI